MKTPFRAALRGIRLRVAVLPILTGLAMPAAFVDAQQVEKGDTPILVKFKLVWHSTKWEPVEVGDEPGHILGVAEFKGLAFFQGGEIATASEVSIFDQTNGHGKTEGYVVLTFSDGATQVIAIQGADETTLEDDKGAFKGSYSYVRGSGRFEGIEGAGTFTGEYYDDVKSGYNDFTGSCRLPAR